MKFTIISIALCGAAIIVVASAMRPQSATAATAEPTSSRSNQKSIRPIGSFRQGSLPKLANFTRKSSLKIRKTIRQPSSWVASRCFRTGSTTRRNGWRRP